MNPSRASSATNCGEDLMPQAQVANISGSRIGLNPLVLDLGLTAATGFTELVASLLVVSLIGRKLGAIALGEYLLLRRVYSWLQSGALLGSSTALPRYVAHALGKPATERAGYFRAALACSGGVAACSGILFNAVRAPLAERFFGSAQRAHLILPLSLMLVGGAVHSVVYGYYRGQLAMKRANALQLCNLVLIPLGAVLALFRVGSVALIVNVVGVSMLVCAGLFAVPILAQLRVAGPPRFRRQAAELLRYGVPRVPAGFLLGGLFALGPMIAAHRLPMARVSALLLGMSLLTGVASSADPLGMILLSKVSMMLAQDRVAELRAHLTHLQPAVLEIYAFTCLQLVVFADVLVRAWVGSRLLEEIVVIRLCLLAIPFYLLYASLRSIVDAAAVTAYNTYNIFVSVVIFLTLIAIAVKTVSLALLLKIIAGSQVAAIVVLACLTSRTVRKLYDVQVDWRRSARALSLGLLLGGTSLLLRWSQGFQTGFGQFLLIELLTGALFLGALKRLGSPWLPSFWNLAFPRRTQAETGFVGQRSRED